MKNYVLNEPKMFADIADGMAIVINTETGIYYGMNGFGTVIFDALIKGISVENIKSALKRLPDAPLDIEQRCDAFVRDLLQDELIIEGSGNEDAITFDPKIATEDHFDMEVKSYADAQEMLLADPIHEVKEETGWTPEKESIGYTKEETRQREKKIEK